ncbi:hypothetical protein OFY17_13025 [Marinomonas sp. C2222]|uniref:DUF5671 domain-containing protein n=1 Tax=Marinomonas sargassi TaxID=2984494 RepID=A0ABT2YV80_9GAMM|nr:hypothetical protein [Marinomonas sargassi]MCV2403789.1 hypothetical protein [Marinomonas sargassi]
MDDQASLSINKESELPLLSTPVLPPRAYIFELIIMLGTFGLYIPIWLVLQVRDIKKLTSAVVTPLAWFFVPLIFITQLFALPRLGRHLSNYEEKLGLKPPKFLYLLWAVIVTTISFLLVLAEKIDDTLLWQLGIIQLVYTFLFSLLVLRINRVKRADSRIKARTRRNPYSWWEWLLLLSGVLLISLSISGSVISDVIAKHDKNSVYVSSEDQFNFPVRLITWYEVETNAEAIKSFVGEESFLTANIYKYDKGTTINEVATFRYSQLMDVNKDYQCVEEQFFLPNSSSVKMIQICEVANIFGINTTLSSVIKNDKEMLEMAIEVVASEDSWSIHLRSAKEAIKGFNIQ